MKMPPPGSAHIEMAYSSISVFMDDGTIDMGELNFLLGLALKDGQVDDDEKRVLSNIFAKVGQSDVSAAVWERINTIKQTHGID